MSILRGARQERICSTHRFIWPSLRFHRHRSAEDHAHRLTNTKHRSSTLRVSKTQRFCDSALQLVKHLWQLRGPVSTLTIQGTLSRQDGKPVGIEYGETISAANGTFTVASGAASAFLLTLAK